MNEKVLEKLFEHNNWANSNILQACSVLSDEQLDSEPESATKGSIRLTLWHLVAAQQAYLSLLTGKPAHYSWETAPAFAEMQEAAVVTGEGLLALIRDEQGNPFRGQIQTKDGYLVEPWVVMVQAINHATEHREQVKNMLSSQGVTPPDLDGWTYGEVTEALVPISV